MKATRFYSILACLYFGSLGFSQEKLPGTQLLKTNEDLAAKMVQGISGWLDGELDRREKNRDEKYAIALSEPGNTPEFRKKMAMELRRELGIPVGPTTIPQMELTGSLEFPALQGENQQLSVFAVRWQVAPGLTGEGLLVEPKKGPTAQVVFMPAPGQSPEEALGWTSIPNSPSQARSLALAGCRVIIPTLIDRKEGFGNNKILGRMTNIPRREFVYRMSYEMGVQVNGLEILKTLSVINWFASRGASLPIGVGGNSDGAWQALLAGVLDDRIRAVLVQGFFGPQTGLWDQPIDRNTWSYLNHFSAPELISLTQGKVVVDMSRYPEYSGANKIGNMAQAAPGKLNLYSMNQLESEQNRAVALAGKAGAKDIYIGVKEGADNPKAGIEAFLRSLGASAREKNEAFPLLSAKNAEANAEARQLRQFQEMVQYCQVLWRDSERVRQGVFANTDVSSSEKWQQTSGKVRDYFWEEVIGKLPQASVPMNPQSRPIYSDPAFLGYEVTLNLYPGVFSQGILLLPKNLKPGEKRPVVVCQHGLEGKPTDVCDPSKKTLYYNSFGAELARLGYIVFAPQNPYIGRDAFRSIQRKANPLGLSLFSFIVRQHEIILQWLKTQPWADEGKIAFYGLSYGGKTAMRVPAILPDYCLSICSGDFNEWVGKNVLVDYPGSYMWTNEYEMYEFNLGNTFNYAEMAYLIAPRPFMVERGHSDGVGIDEMVSWEFSKVRRFYTRMGIGQKTEIEYFLGGHEIHGKGTFAFLKKHLGWPQ
ncbi:MAG: hypothetical protein EXR99_12625 [Gemmataceae bacterium]|nr:hypothetical protein [Gemmataceae bacterium]